MRGTLLHNTTQHSTPRPSHSPTLSADGLHCAALRSERRRVPPDATGEEERLFRFFKTQFAVFKCVAASALALQVGGGGCGWVGGFSGCHFGCPTASVQQRGRGESIVSSSAVSFRLIRRSRAWCWRARRLPRSESRLRVGAL